MDGEEGEKREGGDRNKGIGREGSRGGRRVREKAGFGREKCKEVRREMGGERREDGEKSEDGDRGEEMGSRRGMRG